MDEENLYIQDSHNIILKKQKTINNKLINIKKIDLKSLSKRKSELKVI
jgi:hypothetical protein